MFRGPQSNRLPDHPHLLSRDHDSMDPREAARVGPVRAAGAGSTKHDDGIPGGAGWTIVGSLLLALREAAAELVSGFGAEAVDHSRMATEGDEPVLVVVGFLWCDVTVLPTLLPRTAGGSGSIGVTIPRTSWTPDEAWSEPSHEIQSRLVHIRDWKVSERCSGVRGSGGGGRDRGGSRGGGRRCCGNGGSDSLSC